MNSTILKCKSCGTKNRIPAGKELLRPKCGRCGAALEQTPHDTVINLSDTDFDRMVLQSPLPAMVDFYSPTCGPCQMLAPVVDSLANQFAGAIRIAKLDTSRHHMIAGRYGIRGVPTLIFFKNGQVVDQLVGAAPREQIEQKIRSII